MAIRDLLPTYFIITTYFFNLIQNPKSDKVLISSSQFCSVNTTISLGNGAASLSPNFNRPFTKQTYLAFGKIYVCCGRNEHHTCNMMLLTFLPAFFNPIFLTRIILCSTTIWRITKNYLPPQFFVRPLSSTV